MTTSALPDPTPDPVSFDTFMAQAWDAHAGQPEVVAARLASPGTHLATTPAQLGRLAGLLHHIHGTHLGAWDAGTQALQALLAHPQCTGQAQAEILRALATLALCRGDAPEGPPQSLTDRIRVTAMAAAHLAERDTPRAMALWQDALGQCHALQPGAGDPCHRALAVTGNNLASTLEEKAMRTPAERQLMIEAAQAARLHWEQAGTWLEVERAEYRLARTWLKAGDASQARRHAQACQAIVQAQAAPALEHFFASEALALCAQAAGDGPGLAEARALVERAFAGLAESDRGWCRPILEGLAA